MSETKSIEDKLQIIKARNHGRDSIKDAIVTKQVEAMKYYTPEIEEFHVGFEYETIGKKLNTSNGRYEDEWKKRVVSDDDGETQNPFDNFNYGIQTQTIRVKTLDQSDIESLDYVLHRKDVTMGYDEYCHKRHKEVLPPGNDSNLNVILKKGNNVIVYKNLEIVFRGTIKNKSEFKRIL